MYCIPASAILALLCLASPVHSTGSLQAGLRHRQGSFAMALYRAVAQGRVDTNLVVSPSGVAAALGLLQLGARGNTRAQLEASLGYDVNGTVLTGQRRWCQAVWSGGVATRPRRVRRL